MVMTYAPSESAGSAAAAWKVSSTSRTDGGSDGRVRRRSAKVRVPRVELAHEHGDALPLRPRTRRPKLPGVCDPFDCFGVPGRLLPKVERRQRQAECRDAAEDVGQAAAGDERIAGRDQRAMAESSGAREVGSFEIRPLGREPIPVARRSIRAAAMRARAGEPGGDVAQQRAVRLSRIADASAEARRRRSRSTARCGATRYRAGTSRPRPSAPSRSRGA